MGICLTVGGLVFDAVGLAVIAWPGFFESDGALDQQATPKYDMHPQVRAALFKNRLMLRIGIPLMLVGFGLQAGGALLH